MIDKLVLLSRSIKKRYLKFAIENGRSQWGYGHVADLRSRFGLPIKLYCNGLYNGKYNLTGSIHKIDVLGVAGLGWNKTLEIVEKILPDAQSAKIFRIDFALDIPGISVWDLAESCFVPHAQNIRMFRKRQAISFYPQVSRAKTIIIYDKVAQLAAFNRGATDPLHTGDLLTRLEVQLKGPGVPYKKLADMQRYGDLDSLAGVRLRNVRSIPASLKGVRFLAAYGLRHFVRLHGQQMAAKRVGPQHWAHIRKTLLSRLRSKKMKRIRRRLQRSVRSWLAN